MSEQIRKGIRLTPEELSLFTDAMQRDGMTQLTTWMKSICSQYATGRLTPPAVLPAVPQIDPETATTMEILNSIEKYQNSLIEEIRRLQNRKAEEAD